jgi:predicted nucleotidyltransferase
MIFNPSIMDRVDSASLHPVLPQLLRTLSELGARRVILYGSRSRGDHAPRSDFDLAIDAPELDEAAWSAMQDAVENTDTLYKIDLVWLQQVPDNLRVSILRDGKIIGT